MAKVEDEKFNGECDYMKKVLIISTTRRKNGNSDVLAKEFERGAKEAGNKVEYVSLVDKNINFCTGCFSCKEKEKCFMDDDASVIVDKMRYADVIVFATPIYFNEMCGSMKTLLDRTNPIYIADYRFREIYLLTTAAVNNEFVPDGAVAGLEDWIKCFAKSKLKGVIRGVGIDGVGDAKQNKNILSLTYKMGIKV